MLTSSSEARAASSIISASYPCSLNSAWSCRPQGHRMCVSRENVTLSSYPVLNRQPSEQPSSFTTVCVCVCGGGRGDVSEKYSSRRLAHTGTACAAGMICWPSVGAHAQLFPSSAPHRQLCFQAQATGLKQQQRHPPLPYQTSQLLPRALCPPSCARPRVQCRTPSDP
jgi:hypothetical protein